MNEVTSHTSAVISRLRLPLIILMTYAHSYGSVAEGYSLLACGWDSYEVLKIVVSQTLAKVVTPTFFVISGYLFFANVEQFTPAVYAGKVRRRIKTLLLPYLFWNLLMAVKLGVIRWGDVGLSTLQVFWTFWSEAGRQTDWLGHEQLMTAPANMPLWFLRDLMVMVVLSPVIYISVRRLGFWLIGVLTPLYLSGVCAFTPGLSAYAVYFFTMGATLGIKHIDLADVCQHAGKVAFPLSALLAVAMVASYGQPVFSSLMLGFRLASVAAVIAVGARVGFNCCPGAAMFVYLAHYVVFLSALDDSFFRLFGTAELSLCLHYLLCPLLKAAVFVAIYCAYRKILTNIFGYAKKKS